MLRDDSEVALPRYPYRKGQGVRSEVSVTVSVRVWVRVRVTLILSGFGTGLCLF